MTRTGPRPGGFGALNDKTNEICGAGDLICAAPPEAFSLANLPSGCAFRPRCKFETDECATTDPALMPVTDEPGDGHEVACLHYDQVHLERKIIATVPIPTEAQL